MVQVTTAERAAEQCFPVFLASRPEEPPPGTHVYLLENSHLGSGAFVNAPQPAFPPVNFQNALGFPADVRQTRVRSRCTGKERDAETGLDYFGARYYSGAQGRLRVKTLITLAVIQTTRRVGMDTRTVATIR